MHINLIASISRVVLGLDNRLVDVPIMPKNLDPTRNEAWEGRAGPGRHGTARPKSQL